MIINAILTTLICPLDGTIPADAAKQLALRPTDTVSDNARQGYVHLLPGRTKRSLAPLVTVKEMVAARQRFLSAGHYQPIAAWAVVHVRSRKHCKNHCGARV